MLRVLIVDDDIDIRTLMQLALEGADVSVATASGGDEALAMLAAGERFDVMVLDVQMPECDGWTVLEAVRRSHQAADLRVVMVTVKAHPTDRERARQLGCDRYVTKPFSIADLRAQVLAAAPLVTG